VLNLASIPQGAPLRVTGFASATDSSAAIDAVLTTFSYQLVSRIDGIWEIRKQAKYLEAAAALPSSDPGLLQYFQRKFNPYHPRPASDTKLFHGVRLGHVPGVFTSWQEAHLQTFGVPDDVKRFKTRQKAESFVQSVVTLGQPPLPSPTATSFTGGSASKTLGTAGAASTSATTMLTRSRTYGALCSFRPDQQSVGGRPPAHQQQG